MSKFFKKLIENKSVGYYMAAGIALLAFITAIFFIATQEGNMGNYAAGVGPETIGVFLLAGFIVELVALLLPQYRFIHIVALAMYGLAFYKETILIPDFIAGKINNVEYNGGSFGLNMTYFVLLFIIVVASIVVAFLGFYKDEDQAKKEMSIDKQDKPQIIKVGTGAVIALAAVLVGCLVSKNIVDSSAANTDPLITNTVRKAAKNEHYTLKPKSVLIKEEEKVEDPTTHELVYPYDYSAIKNYPTNGDAPYEGAQLVYRFEGAYAEGYQGDYSQTYAYLCLWEDGLFGGKVNDTQVRGYWFNSSIAEGKDGTVKDCLKMVSNVNHYDSIIAQEATGFYQYQAYAYLGFSWGTRSMILNGYEYYPEVALALNTQDSVLEAYVGEEYDMSSWVPTRILKNLTFSSVFKPVDVTWEAEDGKVDISYVDNNKSRGISSIIGTFDSTGNKKVTIKWGGFEADVTIKVTEAPAEE